MQEPNEKKSIILEAGEPLEVCIDPDHVTIPISRFEELIRAEHTVKILTDLRNTSRYESVTTDELTVLLGPVPSDAKKSDKEDGGF